MDGASGRREWNGRMVRHRDEARSRFGEVLAGGASTPSGWASARRADGCTLHRVDGNLQQFADSAQRVASWRRLDCRGRGPWDDPREPDALQCHDDDDGHHKRGRDDDAHGLVAPVVTHRPVGSGLAAAVAASDARAIARVDAVSYAVRSSFNVKVAAWRRVVEPPHRTHRAALRHIHPALRTCR